MNTLWPLTILTNRAVIKASGKDAARLLQGLLTCNMEQLEAKRLAWGFLLTPQGRFLHELFLLTYEDGFLIDVQAEQVDSFLKRLKLYTLKSDATFNRLEDWAALATPDAVKIEHGALSQDPRLPAMGWRGYAAKQHLATLAASEDMTNYDAHRIALGIPAAEDFVPEKTLLLDYDVDQLGGIDFEKGCYVGQEVTARMHYRAINKKGIYLVQATDPTLALPVRHTPIMAGEHEAGLMLSCFGGSGIAVLRHEYVDGTLFAQSIALTALRPPWVTA